MPSFTKPLPLSLYIHIPWCVQKCPYCDFNSHAVKETLPEVKYVNKLIQNLEYFLSLVKERPLQSIFFGGGTPSLFRGESIKQILQNVRKHFSFVDNIEITLEANPGTVDESRFVEFWEAGINRLSLGVQSFNDHQLKNLGRIHDGDAAKRAIEKAFKAGFTNINLDLMFGLPEQSIHDALADLEMAVSFATPHLSWYQLTIEPNTLFNHKRPRLPHDDLIWEMQAIGQKYLAQANFKQYEVSAYAKQNMVSRHNMNYWTFGDYLGIGAGAHSKLTNVITNEVLRFEQLKHPKLYLTEDFSKVAMKKVSDQELIFEFMLNALRLTDGFSKKLFVERTGLSLEHIESILILAEEKKSLAPNKEIMLPSKLGKRFLNDFMTMFL